MVVVISVDRQINSASFSFAVSTNFLQRNIPAKIDHFKTCCFQHNLDQVLANIVSTGLVSLLVLDDYNGAIAHSVYYGLVLLPGFEEKNLHGDVVAYGVLVQLMIDGEEEKAREMKGFLEKLGIRTTLAEMGAPLEREALTAVLKEIVTGPDMEHIPYEVTEDMVYNALCKLEEL